MRALNLKQTVLSSRNEPPTAQMQTGAQDKRCLFHERHESSRSSPTSGLFSETDNPSWGLHRRMHAGYLTRSRAHRSLCSSGSSRPWQLSGKAIRPPLQRERHQGHSGGISHGTPAPWKPRRRPADPRAATQPRGQRAGRAAGQRIGGRERGSHRERFIHSKVNRTQRLPSLSLTLVRRPGSLRPGRGRFQREGGGEATKPAPMKKPASLSGMKETI